MFEAVGLPMTRQQVQHEVNTINMTSCFPVHYIYVAWYNVFINNNIGNFMSTQLNYSKHLFHLDESFWVILFISLHRFSCF